MIDHEYTQNIVCPHCGYEDRDSWEVVKDSGEMDCGKCEKPFFYERERSTVYSTNIGNPNLSTPFTSDDNQPNKS